MEKKTKEAYIKSGKILTESLKFAKKQVKAGIELLECADKIEKFIQEEGGFPAFPVNISIGNIAAHFSPSAKSTQVFEEKDVAKIDIGVHVNGYITDSAITIDLSGQYGKMLEASQNALETALAIAKSGIEINKLSTAIEKEIKKNGFKPISNLSGHAIEQWIAHAGPSIPNIPTKEKKFLENGKVFAIEPFATDGQGFVHEGIQAEIFGFDKFYPMRQNASRKILEFVEKEFKSLPFAERWIENNTKMTEFERKIGLRELLQKKAIHAYTVLKEIEGKTVTQAETTILIEENDILRLVK